MTKSEPVVTPPANGPAADPALLANAGATSEAKEVGLTMAIDTMQKFGRELENLPAEGRKLVEQALSSVSSTNHQSSKRGTASQRTSKRSEIQQDAFVRLINTLVDLSPAEVNMRPLVDSMILSSIVLAAFSAASLVGTYVLAPILTPIIPPVGSALLSAFAIPAAVYYQLSKGYRALDGFWLLMQAGLAQGVLSGAALANLTVFAEPFIALSAIASSCAIAISYQKSRTTLLAITIVTSLTIHTALGAVEGALSPVYLVLTALYTLALLVPIQMSARDQSQASVNLYAATLVGLSIASKLLVYGMIGANPIVEQVAVIGAQEGAVSAKN